MFPKSHPAAGYSVNQHWSRSFVCADEQRPSTEVPFHPMWRSGAFSSLRQYYLRLDFRGASSTLVRGRFLIQMGVPTNPNAFRIWFSTKRS